MSLPGKVVKVNEESVVVEVSPRPECNGCHACTGLLGGEKKSALKRIDVLKGEFSPRIGDEVILDINPGEGTLAAILVFGIPLASFFVGLLLTPFLCSTFGFELTDQARFISGFSALGLGFFLLAIIARTRSANKLSLKVIEICKKKSPE
ncbi:MAG: SoxR reducing system RseC family protein [Candidatus Rifleibacteriota bacterium]